MIPETTRPEGVVEDEGGALVRHATLSAEVDELEQSPRQMLGRRCRGQSVFAHTACPGVGVLEEMAADRLDPSTVASRAEPHLAARDLQGMHERKGSFGPTKRGCVAQTGSVAKDAVDGVDVGVQVTSLVRRRENRAEYHGLLTAKPRCYL